MLVAVTTGMRRGELLGLRWSDIDLKAARLTVNQSLERVKGKTVFKSPKTTTSRRTITLPALTIEALKEHRAARQQNVCGLALESPSWCLEPISKSFEEDDEAGKLDKAEEILGVVLPANEDPALPLNPGEEALDEPASHVAA